MPTEPPGDLDAALALFEKVDGNLTKLERVWRQLQGPPEPESAERDQLVRAFVDLAQHLPAVDGFLISTMPMMASELQVARFDAWEVGEAELHLKTEQQIAQPGVEVGEYRFLLDRKRRLLVRDRISEVVGGIDLKLTAMSRALESTGITADDWDRLEDSFAELQRLTGSSVPGHARWSEMRRHIRFAQDVDFRDIVSMDWPSVKTEVESNLYDEDEPIPVPVDDLGALVSARPKGRVSTGLAWEALDAESFERLIFELVRTTDGFENVNWLMRTEAADRGRDIEARRVVDNPLFGSQQLRIVIQCKHWLSKSINLADVGYVLSAVTLWEPPPIDIVVIATSGRFTQDAVDWIERNNNERKVPRIEMWPDSHVEAVLSRRPDIVSTFRLR